MPLELGTTALQILADALRDGVVVFDENERACFANAAAYRLLCTTEADLLGASFERVAGVLVAAEEQRARLRAGESIRCESSSTLQVPVRAAWVRLAAAAPGSPPPSALVLHDASLGVALRRVEDVLLATVPTDEPAANDGGRRRSRLLDHLEIVRYLAREVRTSRRSGDPVSVAVLAVPATASAEHVGGLVARMLRGADRVGRLMPSLTEGIARPTEVTAVAFDVALDPAWHWFLVVLPDTPATGAHAAALRLSAQLAGDGGLEAVRVGTSTLDSGASLPSARETAKELVEAAVAACADATAGDVPRPRTDERTAATPS